jgi:hypothetical protein
VEFHRTAQSTTSRRGHPGLIPEESMLDVWCTECYYNRIAVAPSISVCPCQLLLHQFDLIFFVYLLSTLLNSRTESIAIYNNRGGGALILFTTLSLFRYFSQKC